jgi:CDP-glucose 4,6-dehydratase
MTIDAAFWRGRRVLVTGCTGFKGSWLTAWLARMEARVHGCGLDPVTEPALFDLAGIGSLCERLPCDVRDPDAVRATVELARPEIVFHLAAQPLVLESLRDPLRTFSTNLMGTIHLLEAIRAVGGVRAAVIVTSDKCYRDTRLPCAEDDALGGIEPYSASKACAEIAVGAWRASFMGSDSGIGVASARAGNVIGGGDFSADRLLPDLIRAAEAGRTTMLRHPHAIRPWQHVLDALSGYLSLAQALHARPRDFATSWNFGPPDDANWTVAEMADAALKRLGYGSWRAEERAYRHETAILRLSANRARQRLGWRPRLDTARAVAWAVDGYRDLLAGRGRAWLDGQIDRYLDEQPAQMPSGAMAMPETAHA